MKTNKVIATAFAVFFFFSTLSVEAPVALANFNDVQEGTRHYVAIKKLAELGMIEGYEDGSFKPWQKITRAEALKLILKANNLVEDENVEEEDDKQEEQDDKQEEQDDKQEEQSKRPFTDTPLDEWYIPYLKVALENEIVSGYEDGSFKPNQSVSLSEMLKIVLESDPEVIYVNTAEFLFDDTPEEAWYAKYTAYAKSKNLVDIAPNNTIMPDQEMTRGYFAEVIYRKIESKNGYDFGKASYYGKQMQGRNTASGEKLNIDDFITAHKSLPFNTKVEVTNLATGKSIVVRVIDRGPYTPGRALDLSTSAFESLASLSTGVINVAYKVLPNE